MKRYLLACGLAACALGALAQAPPDVSRVTIPRGPETIELPPSYSRIWAGEFDSVQGAYDLSNGETMALTKWVNRKFVKIGDMPKTEVVAVGDYDFVSLDQKYRIVLSEPVFGEVTGYVLMKRPSAAPALSATEPASIVRLTLASR